MTSALAVNQRHLALPDSCLFAHTELAIPAQTSQSEYQKLGAGLSKIDSANDFWLADYAAFGLKWENGLELGAAATGRTPYHLKRCAQVALRFTPCKRFSYTVAHLRRVMPFPAAFTDIFLPKVAHLNLSVKALRIRAEAEYGSNPYSAKNPKKRSVPIRAELWASLQAYAPSKVSALIERICENWLANPQTEHIPAVQKAETKKAEKIVEPLDMASQLARFKKAHPEYGKDSVGVARNDVPKPAAAKPQPKSGNEKCTCKIDLCWSTCKGPDVFQKYSPDSFQTLEAAQAASEQYFDCVHKWHPFPAFCELCKTFHLYRDSQEQKNG